MNIFTKDDYRKIQAWLKANSIKDSDLTSVNDTIPEEDTLVLVQKINGILSNVKISIKNLLNSTLSKVIIDTIIANAVKVNNTLTVTASNVKIDNEKGTTLQDVLDYFEGNKLNRHTDDTFDGNLTVKKNITIEGNIKSHDGTTTVEADLEATGEITDGQGNILSDVNDASKGWKIEYQDPRQDEPTVRAKYVLKDYRGVPKGSVIKIYKDSAITNVYLGTIEDTCNPDTGEVTKNPIHNNNEALSIVYRLDTGKYSLVNVPIKMFTTEAEFDKYRGLGVTSNGQIFIKLASDVESSNYLHFNELGEITADGIETRILRDLGNIITSVIEDGTMWGVYKEHEGTQETSTPNDGSRWGEFKRAEKIREEISNSAHQVFADNWDAQDDAPEEYDPLAVTEASYAYNWKSVTNPNKTGNIEDLVNKVDALAVGIFYGYYPNKNELPQDITEKGYAYIGTDNPYKIYNFDGSQWRDSGTTIQATSEVDEEDITYNENNKLTFKDRNNTDGMGYVILRKNKSFAEQVTKENTVYEIRYNFDLNGQEITIPEGCVLDFQGGSLSNGKIIGLNTLLNTNSIHILKNINIVGTWNNENSYSDWFETDNYDASILISLQNLSKNIYIKNNFNTSEGIAVGLNKYTGEDDADIIISDNHNIIGDGTHSIIFRKMVFHNNVIVRNCIFDGNWNCKWASVSGNNVLIENTSFINIKSNAEGLATIGLYLGNWYNQTDGYIWENVTINNCVFDGFEPYLSDDINNDNVNGHVSRAIMAYSAINVRISNSTFKNMKGLKDSDYIMLHNLKQSDSRFPFDGTLILDYPTKDMTTLGRYNNMDAIICNNHFYQGLNKSSIKIMASNVIVSNNMFVLSGETKSWGCIRGYNSENCIISNNNIIVNSGNYETIFEFRRCLNLNIHNNNIAFDKVSYIKNLVNSQCNNDFLFSNNNIKGNNLEILIMTTYSNINCINNQVIIDNTNIEPEIICKLLYGYGDIGIYKFPVIENIATVIFTNNRISYKSNGNDLEFLPQYTENCNISNNIFECDNSIIFYTPADLSIYHDNCYYKYNNNISNCMIFIQGFKRQVKHLALVDIINNNLRAILIIADKSNIINNTFEVGTATTNYYIRFQKNCIADIRNNIFKKASFVISAFSIIDNSILKVNYTNNNNENEFYSYIDTTSSLSENSHVDSLNKNIGLDYGYERTFNNLKSDSIFSFVGKTFIISDKGKFVFHDGKEWKTGDGFVLENRTGKFANKPSNLSWKDRGFPYYDEDSNRMIYYKGYKTENDDGWITSDGVNASLKNKGSDSERPILSSTNNGYEFFDTTLNKPIWWTGEKWVDATGTDV